MEAKEDRRRHIRWLLKQRASGRITAMYEASLVNISLGGTLIEHLHLLRPRSMTFSTLFVHGQEVSLPCGVLHGSEIPTSGERELIYRTGLEFRALSEHSQRLLGEYIDALRGER